MGPELHPFQAPRSAAAGSELRSTEGGFETLFNGLNLHDSTLLRWSLADNPPRLTAVVELDLFWSEPGAGTPAARGTRRLELEFKRPFLTEVEPAGRSDAALASLDGGMVILDEVRCGHIQAAGSEPGGWEFRFGYCVDEAPGKATLVRLHCESVRLLLAD